MSFPAEFVTAPQPLLRTHDTASFDCGEATLNDWLRRNALKNEQGGASRTYVVCVDARVIGYYALAAGAIANENAPGRMRRNMPDPIPVMVLGRLAVDLRYSGRGIASGLLRDAVIRTLQAAEIAGIRAILVHALSQNAKRFYERRGFAPSATELLTLMITVQDAKASLI